MTNNLQPTDYQQLVNHYLQETFHQVQGFDDPDGLWQAMDYSVEAGGKRLRPALTLAVLVAFGSQIDDNLIRLSSAVELMHTYSLIHDDLPAMDNDDLRRGQATNHRRFGEAMAILAGDGLQSLAFEWLTSASAKPAVVAALAAQLAQSSGPTGMVGGQAMDVYYSTQQIKLPLERLQELHAQKTGALITYSVVAGGIITEQSDDVLGLLKSFGQHYGLAFQIYDDLMDVLGTAKSMGKAVHKDRAEAKNTYPGLLGVHDSEQVLAEVVTAAQADLNELNALTGIETGELAAFLKYFKL